MVVVANESERKERLKKLSPAKQSKTKKNSSGKTAQSSSYLPIYI